MSLANPALDPIVKGPVVVLATGPWMEPTVRDSMPTNGMTDSPNWAQALRQISESGDRQAFEQVFAHFAPRVKAYMMRLGSDGASAEELTQEAMAAVWRKAGSQIGTGWRQRA